MAIREVKLREFRVILLVKIRTITFAKTLRQKMATAVYANGSKVYTLATGLSLLIFYAFALQCMSTLAIVKRETGSWKYPLFQFVAMGILAYLSSFIVFQVFR